MSATERFLIGSYCTAKAMHVMNISEYAHRYGGEKKKKVLNGEVVNTRNKRTETGRASWYVRDRYHLGEGQTKLAKINMRSVKKAAAPTIQVEEPETPVALPAGRRKTIDTIAVVVVPLALESDFHVNTLHHPHQQFYRLHHNQQ